jgi:chromosome segregation ATPase
MYAQLNAQLADTKEKLDRLKRLKASLIPAQERLTAEAHHVQGIENCLAEVEDQIQSLESFSLQSVMDSIMWRKEGKLNHLREELARLSPEVETGERTLLELDSAVKEIEAEIASLGNAEETYKTICDQKCVQILANGGEPAAQLQDLSSQLNAAKHERQSLRKSMQIAKNLIERLRSMTKAVGRAKGKMIHGGIGAIASAAVNTVHLKGADGSIRRAREGLQEFARSIEALNVVSGCERDEELVRLGTVLAHSNADLGGGGTLSPLIDVIHQALGLVQTKLDEVEPTVASLEAQRVEIVENA